MNMNNNDWCTKGEESYNKGQFEKAIHFYERCIIMNRNNIEGWKNKCECLNFLGKYKEAEDCCDEALKIDSKNADVLAVKGESLNFLGRYDEALNCSKEALGIDPDNAYASYVKGYALDYSGRHHDAIKDYDQAIELKSDDSDYWTSKGIAYNYLKYYTQAIECFNKAKDTEGAYHQQIAYALINKGESLLRLKKGEESSDCFKNALTESVEAIKDNPTDSHAWTFKGISLYRLGWNDRALCCFDRVIEGINPKFDLAWYLRGSILGSSGRHYEALKYYNEALRLNKTDADYLTSKGISLYELENYKDALECFKGAVKIDKSYEIAYLKIGECKYRDECYDEAVQNYNEVSDPDYEGIKYNNIGTCYYRQKKFKEAKEAYEKGIEVYKKGTEHKSGEAYYNAYYNLGVLYNSKKNLDEAKAIFEICALQKEYRLLASMAKDNLKELNNIPQSDWFQWWFGREKIRKTIGLVLISSIIAVILSTAILIGYLINEQGLDQYHIIGLTTILAFLIFILVLPNLRKFKISEVEFETLYVSFVTPEHELEPTVFSKTKFESKSF
jgi:tetratricopeptide (TPR) repeat protein